MDTSYVNSIATAELTRIKNMKSFKMQTLRVSRIKHLCRGIKNLIKEKEELQKQHKIEIDQVTKDLLLKIKENKRLKTKCKKIDIL